MDDFLRTDDLAADFDHVPRGDECSESFHGATVDLDAAFQNEGLHTAP
jgi:hypothetical protein